MDNIKDDKYYLGKILSDVSFVILHTKGRSLEEFSQDEVLVDCVLFRLIQIAENAAKLTTAFKSENPLADWQAIGGLRNRIVHDYGKVDLAIIYETVKGDLPQLQKYLSNIYIKK